MPLTPSIPSNRERVVPFPRRADRSFCGDRCSYWLPLLGKKNKIYIFGVLHSKAEDLEEVWFGRGGTLDIAVVCTLEQSCKIRI